MALYDKLLGYDPGGIKLMVHAFMAALGEYARGKMTGPQIITAFGLDAAEQTEAQIIPCCNGMFAGPRLAPVPSPGNCGTKPTEWRSVE
jgi:hypothetical protein